LPILFEIPLYSPIHLEEKNMSKLNTILAISGPTILSFRDS